jgi:hypothetical protein
MQIEFWSPFLPRLGDRRFASLAALTLLIFGRRLEPPRFRWRAERASPLSFCIGQRWFGMPLCAFILAMRRFAYYKCDSLIWRLHSLTSRPETAFSTASDCYMRKSNLITVVDFSEALGESERLARGQRVLQSILDFWIFLRLRRKSCHFSSNCYLSPRRWSMAFFFVYLRGKFGDVLRLSASIGSCLNSNNGMESLVTRVISLKLAMNFWNLFRR